MSTDLRQLVLPYCLDRQPDGRYAALNRKYKPIGFTTPSARHLEYAEYPVLMSIKGLTAAMAAKISWDGSQDLSRIYLYNDGCIPTDSAAHWATYAARLRLLAGLKADD